MKIVCFLLKLVLKILLLPVAFLLRFLCFIGNLLMQLSLWVLSPVMLFVLGCGIYSVVRASWTDAFLLTLIEMGLFAGAVDENHNVTLLSDKIKSKIDKLSIPDGYSIDMEGEDETINESMSQLVLMLVLAVIFIYLIMVAQFQSLLSPFIIMFCIPLAFTGGFIALFITGNELGIISMLGFIMLAGLIVNNGIVLIDYINQARREGMSKHEAIIDAGRTRLRPILMTAMTTILAMFTSAIGIGDGSDMIKPMAIAIIGGLVYGTILTLIVIPCIYDAFNREKSMVEEEL